MSERNELLIGILAVIVFCGGIYVLAHNKKPASKAAVQEPARSMPALPSAAVLAQLKESNGFQYLISYTARGFEPSTVTIKKGETIRFVNNSASDLWVASAANGTAGVYPSGSGNECGQSAFDTCHALKSGEFWEFTFTTVGTWGYQNNNDVKMTGTVRVR